MLVWGRAPREPALSEVEGSKPSAARLHLEPPHRHDDAALELSSRQSYSQPRATSHRPISLERRNKLPFLRRPEQLCIGPLRLSSRFGGANLSRRIDLQIQQQLRLR